MASTYEIEHISDLLKVPVERRAACLHELEIALALCELAFGEQASVGPFSWTDDEHGHCALTDDAGASILKMAVTYGKDECAPQDESESS